MASPERRVELTRAVIQAYLAGDLDTVVALMSPDVTVVTGPGMAEAGTYTGADEFVPWSHRWLDAWDEFNMDVESIEPLGERHVVAGVRQSGRGRGSGIEVEMDTGHVYGYEDETLVYFAIYMSLEQALADARSREEDLAMG
jgi:ketosteroid isomerase-like protein